MYLLISIVTCIIRFLLISFFFTEQKITRSYKSQCELYIYINLDNLKMHNLKNLLNPSEFVTKICTRIISAMNSNHILNNLLLNNGIHSLSILPGRLTIAFFICQRSYQRYNTEVYNRTTKVSGM